MGNMDQSKGQRTHVILEASREGILEAIFEQRLEGGEQWTVVRLKMCRLKMPRIAFPDGSSWCGHGGMAAHSSCACGVGSAGLPQEVKSTPRPGRLALANGTPAT